MTCINNASYEITTYSVMVILQLITGYFLTRLYQAFTNDSGRKRKVCYAGVAYCLICLLFFFVLWNTTWGNSVAYVVAFLTSFAIYYFFDRENVRLKIYLAFTFYVVRWLALGISVRANVLLDSVLSYIYERTLDYSNMDMANIMFFWEYVICQLLDVIVYALILWYFVRKLTEIYKNKDKELGNRELVLLLIPAFIGGSSYLLNMMYSYKYNETASFLLYGLKLAGFIWIMYFVILIASILITVSFYQQMQEKQENEARMRMLENSVMDIQAHIKEVENLYSQVRSIKHDINNHAEVLAGLLNNGDTDEAVEYLKSFQDIADMSDFKIKTGNPVTDVVINEKMQEAEKMGIDFKSDFHYPLDSNLNAFDVSIVLNNALSNAIEAVSGTCGTVENSRFISVSSFKNKNMYLITVTNSFKGRLELNNSTGLPRSTKTDADVHGIGMQNIKMVADKYFGDAKLEVRDNAAVLTVMMKISR